MGSNCCRAPADAARGEIPSPSTRPRNPFNDPMRILLTNDDGIYAPGLRALRNELKHLGDVTVVAPATEQSAAGHSVTLLNPLLVSEVFEDDGVTFIGWAVE